MLASSLRLPGPSLIGRRILQPRGSPSHNSGPAARGTSHTGDKTSPLRDSQTRSLSTAWDLFIPSGSPEQGWRSTGLRLSCQQHRGWPLLRRAPLSNSEETTHPPPRFSARPRPPGCHL